jgi:hypothetical protein
MGKVHRRAAEDAKIKNIFLSADPIESEADMKAEKNYRLKPL